jgi:hypothetical protein
VTSLLFGIITAALLSFTSLLVVIFRVSPLTSPGYAIPTFLISLFLTITSVGILVFYFFWKFTPIHTWDLAKIVSVSVRQGVMLGLACVIVILFHLLGLLSWWIAILIFGVFLLIELALNS